MGTNMAAGNKQKHLSLSFATKHARVIKKKLHKTVYIVKDVRNDHIPVGNLMNILIDCCLVVSDTEFKVPMTDSTLGCDVESEKNFL